jgi:hypothetical protein
MCHASVARAINVSLNEKKKIGEFFLLRAKFFGLIWRYNICRQELATSTLIPQIIIGQNGT